MVIGKKKPSAAQLRARKLFAERAKAGTFKRKAKRTRRRDTNYEQAFERDQEKKPKRRATKPPSPAQLAARAKFVKMVRARAAAKKKTNSRGFSGKAPAWTRSKKAKRVNKRQRGTTSHNVRSLMSQAHRAKSRQHLGLLRGKFDKALRSAKLSEPLRESALREFERIAPKNLPRRKPKKRNPIRMSEAEARRYAPKIKGLSLVGGSSKATVGRKKKARFKKPAKRALARAFSGSGFLGLGRSTKRVRARNPKGIHLPGLPAKYQRMYEDILASSGSKQIAAATTKAVFKRENPGKGIPSFRQMAATYKRTGKSWRKAASRAYKTGHRSKALGFAKIAGEHRKMRRLFGHKNPSPASVFSEFRGKDVRSRTKSTGHGSGRLTVAQLGQLRELKLMGKKLAFGGKALLCADGRKKLHIGGVRFKANGGEEDMGEVHSVTYRSDKPHIETGTFDYVHKFGENGGKRPRLIVDAEGYPFFEGGSYKIDADGIIN